MIQKIATTALYVESQEEAVNFWVSKVGFTIHTEKQMGPDAKWIELGPEGAATCLVIYPKAMMDDWAERKPSLVFECENIQETYEAMLGRGVKFTQEPKQMPWAWFAAFNDNEGHWHGLRQPL